VQRGLSYLILEKENTISSTVSRYPKGKLVMAEPYETSNLSLLPIFDSTKEDMVALWKELAKLVKLQIKMHETVQIVQKQRDGSFLTTSTAGQYRSQRVVLATGTRGKPRTLGVPGEHLPKVESLLEDPDVHRGKAVCVVGGGDSALEAALALSQAGAKVIVSYRGRSFHRAQAKNRQDIDAKAAEGRIKIKMQSEVVEFAEETITLQMSDGTQKRYPNHASFVLIGADPPIQWLSSLGINYIERPHMQPMPASDAMVRQLVPGARDCPEVAEDAAAQVFGRPIKSAPKKKKHPPKQQEAGVGRRFIRSASSLFHMRDEKAKRPIPLSQFAQGAAGTDGVGRQAKRDQLEPGERTRILRMLRDEGGRQADEDSQVHRSNSILEDYEPEVFNPIETSAPSAPPAPTPSTPSTPSQRPASKGSALLATLPPPIAGNEATQEGAPRQALIVGLAKATADAPRASRRRRRPAPEVHEERTQHLPLEQARALGEAAKQPSAKPPSAKPPPPSSKPKPRGLRAPVMEEPTSLLDFDPAQMMREAESARPPMFSRTDTANEEATRNVDVNTLLAEGGINTMPGAAQDPPTDPGPGLEDRARLSEDEYEPRSLSEVDWDLD
jgi:thioredoxin reductase